MIGPSNQCTRKCHCIIALRRIASCREDVLQFPWPRISRDTWIEWNGIMTCPTLERSFFLSNGTITLAVFNEKLTFDIIETKTILEFSYNVRRRKDACRTSYRILSFCTNAKNIHIVVPIELCMTYNSMRESSSYIYIYIYIYIYNFFMYMYTYIYCGFFIVNAE